MEHVTNLNDNLSNDFVVNKNGYSAGNDDVDMKMNDDDYYDGNYVTDNEWVKSSVLLMTTMKNIKITILIIIFLKLCR